MAQHAATKKAASSDPQVADPAPVSSESIRAEIERTRADIEKTFEAIGNESFSERVSLELFKGGTSSGRRLWQIAREHPMPAAVIGLGMAWLLIEDARETKVGEKEGQALPQPRGKGEHPAEENVPAVVDSTLAYLHARGLQVEPESLSVLFEDALHDMRRTLYPPNPAADLPAPEVAALRRGGFKLEPLSSESSNTLARTAAEYAVLCNTSLTAGETAQKLGVDPSRVRQLLAARKIYGLQIRGAWKIPIFQFEGDRLLPGLEEVVPALPEDLHSVAIYHWFTTPNPDLVPGGLEQALSPREWLLSGHSSKVVAELAADLDNL
jgi:hypothetical protein